MIECMHDAHMEKKFFYGFSGNPGKFTAHPSLPRLSPLFLNQNDAWYILNQHHEIYKIVYKSLVPHS